MGFNCYYDVKNLKMQSLTTFLSRDMHCWQLAINVTPVGPWRSFNITHKSEIQYTKGSAYQPYQNFLLMLQDIIFHGIKYS